MTPDNTPADAGAPGHSDTPPSDGAGVGGDNFDAQATFSRVRWARLWQDLLKPRGWRTDVPIAILTLILGIGLVVSVQAQKGPAGLALDNTDDLVGILADLGTRGQRLQVDIAQLQQEQDQLETGSSGIALQAAQQRAAELAILAGTVGAEGPGIVMVVTDPTHAVTADILVDAVEELRDAGAEAIDISGVRVVTQTSIVDSAQGITIDGQARVAPYTFTAIGDPTTLSEALEIPGGVTDTVASVGGGAKAVVTNGSEVRITSLRTLTTPRYARPAPTASSAK